MRHQFPFILAFSVFLNYYCFCYPCKSRGTSPPGQDWQSQAHWAFTQYLYHVVYSAIPIAPLWVTVTGLCPGRLPFITKLPPLSMTVMTV